VALTVAILLATSVVEVVAAETLALKKHPLAQISVKANTLDD